MRQNEFIQLNKSKGLHWFDHDTMRFFGTRISNWDIISGLFITSEQPPHGSRVYSVRLADFDTGQVYTVSEFCEFNSIRSAKTALRKFQRMHPDERAKLAKVTR